MMAKDDCEAGYSQESISRSSPSPTYFLPFEHCLQQELVQDCLETLKALNSSPACADLASALAFFFRSCLYLLLAVLSDDGRGSLSNGEDTLEMLS